LKKVVETGFTGFYLRVLKEGRVSPGDRLVFKERDARRISVAHANRIFHHDRKNREGVEAVLKLPALSASWRESFEKLKQAIDKAGDA